jgi:hypothetical protein
LSLRLASKYDTVAGVDADLLVAEGPLERRFDLAEIAIDRRRTVVIGIEPIRERFSAVAPFLDERGRRLVAAAEAFAAGYGGIAAVAMATGVAPSTIGRGLKELAQDEPFERIRRAGAGRKRTISKDQTLLPDLEALVEPTTCGDPESPSRGRGADHPRTGSLGEGR